jgi:hypothetical protein
MKRSDFKTSDEYLWAKHWQQQGHNPQAAFECMTLSDEGYEHFYQRGEDGLIRSENGLIVPAAMRYVAMPGRLDGDPPSPTRYWVVDTHAGKYGRLIQRDLTPEAAAPLGPVPLSNRRAVTYFVRWQCPTLQRQREVIKHTKADAKALHERALQLDPGAKRGTYPSYRS